MISFLYSQFPKPILIFLVLLFTQQSVIQSAERRKVTTNYLEADRINVNAFDLPLHIKPELSGGFAELRINHLHSGLDFKTQRAVGYPIYAPTDGWVSRIRISSFGFGNALYLGHANGFTTVYGHLLNYAEPIASVAENMQYKAERFELDTLLSSRLIPVRKGQIIAYSGSSGQSAAPHLHFEIRDSRTEETLDPLLWYCDRIKDDIPPKPNKIALYAMEGEGVLSSGNLKAIVPVLKNKAGEWVVNGVLPSAWGKIGFGLNAYDYMDGNSNHYGICSIRLFEEDQLIFQQDLSRFNFDQTRFVNSLVDYETMKRNNTWIMKSFVEPENKLNVYPSLKDKGYVLLNEQKSYSFRYELMDRAGNSTVIRFSIQGRKQPIKAKVFTGKKFIPWADNYFNTNDVNLTIPAGALYNTLDFHYEQKTSVGYSDLFVLQNAWTPLQSPIKARFRIQRDVLSEKRQYYLAKVAENGRTSIVDGTYINGWMEGVLKDFGSYKVLSDTVMPKITGSNLESIAKNGVIRIRIADYASGIKSWEANIDGKWALFALDGKSGWLSCVLDKNRVDFHREHSLRLTVQDACGNESVFENTFFW